MRLPWVNHQNGILEARQSAEELDRQHRIAQAQPNRVRNQALATAFADALERSPDPQRIRPRDKSVVGVNLVALNIPEARDWFRWPNSQDRNQLLWMELSVSQLDVRPRDSVCEDSQTVRFFAANDETVRRVLFTALRQLDGSGPGFEDWDTHLNSLIEEAESEAASFSQEIANAESAARAANQLLATRSRTPIAWPKWTAEVYLLLVGLVTCRGWIRRGIVALRDSTRQSQERRSASDMRATNRERAVREFRSAVALEKQRLLDAIANECAAFRTEAEPPTRHPSIERIIRGQFVASADRVENLARQHYEEWPELRGEQPLNSVILEERTSFLSESDIQQLVDRESAKNVPQSNLSDRRIEMELQEAHRLNSSLAQEREAEAAKGIRTEAAVAQTRRLAKVLADEVRQKQTQLDAIRRDGSLDRFEREQTVAVLQKDITKLQDELAAVERDEDHD